MGDLCRVAYNLVRQVPAGDVPTNQAEQALAPSPLLKIDLNICKPIFPFHIGTLWNPMNWSSYPGTIIFDPHRGLENLDSPDTQAWMQAQDQKTRADLAQTPSYEALRTRLDQLYLTPSIADFPTRVGSAYFYTRQVPDQGEKILFVRIGRNGQERKLLDPNQIEGSLGGFSVSRDGTKLGFIIQPKNNDESVYYILDVETGKTRSTDVILNVRNNPPVWDAFGKGFYYTYYPSGVKSYADSEIRYHALGTSQENDPLIFPHTGDDKKFIGSQTSRDGHWLLAYVWIGKTNEIFIRDLKDPQGSFSPLYSAPETRSLALAHQDRFYLQTNDHAPKNKILKKDQQNSAWTELIPERSDVVINDFGIIGDKLVLRVFKNARSSLEVWSLEGKLIRELNPEGSSITNIDGDVDSPELLVYLESPLKQPTVYSASMATIGSKEDLGLQVWQKNDQFPFDPSRFHVEQVFYPSKDGTPISLFLVKKKDLKLDGNNPVLLYGYGGFNKSLEPKFEAWVLPWLEAGGVYAIANLRGGGEYGEDWHQAGMRDKKQNVFDDFIAAAEYLIQQKYTSFKKLAIYGRSNGGLLTAAMLTQRPELFRAVISGVPLTDMLRYTEAGVGKSWQSEYGNPQKPGEFDTLYRYSPYHNVRKGSFPAVLIDASLVDNRTGAMHPFKMAAQLQEANTGSNPIYLRVEQKSGHQGTGNHKDDVERFAGLLAFLMKELGMDFPQ